MTENVLAVDPGKMTGWAWWGQQAGVWRFESGELPHLEFLRWADTIVQPHLFPFVVCENFIITAATLKKSRGESWSLKQIGCLEYWCAVRGVDFTLQKSADGLTFGSTERLKQIGFYVPGKGHSNDASSHLITWLADRKRYNGREIDAMPIPVV